MHCSELFLSDKMWCRQECVSETLDPAGSYIEEAEDYIAT